MTGINGYAYTPTEKEEGAARVKRFMEIKHLRKEIELAPDPQYKRTHYRGRLITDEAKALSDKDIALLCDWGSVCFGGSVTRSGDTFVCSIWTD